MSLAANGNVEPVLVMDRRLGFSDKANFGVIKSGRQNTYVVLPTQNYSTSNVTFNAQPPAPNIAINREVMAKFYFTVNITATAGPSGTVIDPGLYDAPRFMPLASCTQNVNVTLNNGTVSMNTYQCIHAFTRSNLSDADYKTDLSTAPSMPDFYQNYGDPYTQALGIVNDPLQTIGQTSQGWQTRGGFPYEIVSNPNVGAGNSGTAVVRFSSCEPLIISPFLTGSDDKAALIGVQTLTLQFNLLNLARVWSHSDAPDASVVSAVAVTLTQPPELLLNFITPSQVDPIPSSVVYSYNNVDVYPTDFPTPVAPLTAFTVPSQNIQLNVIPRRIYVFLRQRDADQTVVSTDTFAQITGVSINFDNQSGILAGANSEQLYELSKNSGLNMSWAQWSKHTGSVLILDVGRSLMLQNENEAPSLSTTKQLQVTVQARNLNTTKAIQFTMYILAVSDGLLTVTNNTTVLQNSVLTPGDIAMARESGVAKDWETSTNFYGGSFFRKLKKAAKAVASAAKKTHALSTIAALTGNPTIATTSGLLGYGGSGGSGGAIVGGPSGSGSGSGGAIVGGKRVSKAALRASLSEAF